MQRLVARPMVEQEGQGMTQHLPQQPTRQMPEVARPHPLYGVTSGELRKDRVYSVAKPAQKGALVRGRVSFLGRVRGQKLHAHARQLPSLVFGEW